MIEEIGDYQLLKKGDLVRCIENPKSGTGIITEVGKRGAIYIFWSSSGKVTHSGKKWAEEHLVLVDYD